MASAEVSSPTKVKFDADDVIERQKLRQPPTQRYDRKEVQKRLDIEQWMDEQLRRLFGCKNDQDAYPELDLDDVMKIDESSRQERLGEYLKESKLPEEVPAFIKELLERLQSVKSSASH